MSLRIKNAILHILRSGDTESLFSVNELDIDSEMCEAFIKKHAKKLINNAAAKSAVFKPESALYGILQSYQSNEIFFKETALLIAGKMDELMRTYESIMPCDLLVARVGDKHGEYLLAVLLPYHEVYTHKTKENDNQLSLVTALPFTSGKVECAVLINLDGASLSMHLLEKPMILNGKSEMVFSEMFLECDTTPSKKEQAVLINEVTTEFVDEYFHNDPNVITKIKSAIVDQAEEDEGFVSMDNVARLAFENEEDSREDYVNVLRSAGFVADVPLGTRIVKQQFATHKIKAENGVEIKFPAPLAAEEDQVEITNNPDGTISVLFKNLIVV